MSVQFSGLGSGLPINEWIEKLVAAKKTSITPLEKKQEALKNQSSALDTIKNSYTALQNALKTFTDVISGTSNDIWSKTTITSSNDQYVSATSSTGLATGNIKISVQQLATSTVAQGTVNPAKLIDNDTKYSLVGNNQAKGGTFSIYVDNKRYEIDIDKDNDTLGDIATKLNDATGGKINAKVNSDGTFEIEALNGEKISIGAVSDKSNFASIMKLTDETASGIKSAYSLTSFRTNVSLTSADNGLNQPVTAGTIKINGVEFKIDENTALKDLINEINSTDEAKVSAQYDSLTNKLIFTSKETGEFNIALEQEGTNFFDVFGLTKDGGLAEGSQTLGQNAELTVNGNKIVSSSNTITSESTGIVGLTINAKKVTDGTDTDATNEVSLNIQNDTTDVKKALKDFVSAYNKVAEQIKEATAKDGYLEMDSSLRNLQQEMRSMLTNFVPDNGSYNMLSQIGISTGKAGLDVSNSAITLEFDEEKFNEAYSKDAVSVRNLLSGGTSGTGTGIFDKMNEKTTKVLDATSGLFKTKSDTISRLLQMQDEKVTKAYENLDTYEAQITKQFQYMDEMIAKMQQQYASFTSTLS